MIQELILTFACVSGTACDQTRYTYLSANPETKAYIQNTEQNLQRYIPNKFYSDKIIPVLVAARNGEFKIHVSKNLTLGYKKDDTVYGNLTYGLEY